MKQIRGFLAMCTCTCGETNTGILAGAILQDGGHHDAVLLASVTADPGLPAADATADWAAVDAAQRVSAWAQGDPAKLAAAYLYCDPGADPAAADAYRFLVADVQAGQLVTVPAALPAAYSGVEQATDLPAAVKAKIKSRLGRLNQATAAAVTAAAGTVLLLSMADGTSIEATITDVDEQTATAGVTTSDGVKRRMPLSAIALSADAGQVVDLDVTDTLANTMPGIDAQDLREAIAAGTADGLARYAGRAAELSALDAQMTRGALPGDGQDLRP